MYVIPEQLKKTQAYILYLLIQYAYILLLIILITVYTHKHTCMSKSSMPKMLLVQMTWFSASDGITCCQILHPIEHNMHGESGRMSTTANNNYLKRYYVLFFVVLHKYQVSEVISM